MYTFFHCDCVTKLGEAKFTERYRSWCKKHGYYFTIKSAVKIFAAAMNQVLSLPCDADTRLLISESAKQLTCVSATVEIWRTKVHELASLLPEYDCVMSMYGCGETTGPQLMAEIGDPTRFVNKKALVNFAGIAPGDNQSGTYQQKSVPVSKKGSPHLRKTLFQVMSTYLKHSPAEQPVYQFLDRKRYEGKGFYVYMTAGANKFLRQYYARAIEHLKTLGLKESIQA